MTKKKWRLFFTLCMLSLFLIVPTPTLGAEDHTDTWQAKTITDSNKVWTITFSQPLKKSSVTKTTVNIKDEKNRTVSTDVSLSKDKKSIIVTPKSAYEEDQSYTLTISSKVTSDKGKKLEKSIVLPFTLDAIAEKDEPIKDEPIKDEPIKDEPIKDEPIKDEPIKNVVIQHNSYITSVKASSNGSVTKLTANNKEMHYEGNNTYSLGLTELTSGDSITIKAYDHNNKLIFSKDYHVN